MNLVSGTWIHVLPQAEGVVNTTAAESFRGLRLFDLSYSCWKWGSIREGGDTSSHHKASPCSAMHSWEHTGWFFHANSLTEVSLKTYSETMFFLCVLVWEVHPFCPFLFVTCPLVPQQGFLWRHKGQQHVVSFLLPAAYAEGPVNKTCCLSSGETKTTQSQTVSFISQCVLFPFVSV